jgi:hypothetical protein
MTNVEPLTSTRACLLTALFALQSDWVVSVSIHGNHRIEAHGINFTFILTRHACYNYSLLLAPSSRIHLLDLALLTAL